MTETVEIRPQFAEALQTENWDRVEELWLEALEESPIPTTELFEVRRLIWKAGKKNLARTLLDLLAESLEESGATADALEALRELTRLAGFVALVVLPQDFSGRRIDDHGLDRGRSHIHAYIQVAQADPFCEATLAETRPGHQLD